MTWHGKLLFILLVVFSFAGSVSASIVQPIENSQQTNADQNSKACACQKQPTESFWQRTMSDPIALYTALLSILTAVLAVSTIGLWKQTKRLAHDAEQNSITTQRAFVFATGVNAFWDPASAGIPYSWRFRPTWRNSGDTPTRNMTIHTACELRNTPLPDDFDFDYSTNNVGTGLLGPKFEQFGGIAPDRPLPAITPQDIVEVQNQRKFLYLMGWVRYDDVFPDTPQRLTRFCWQIVVTGDPNEIPNQLVFGNLHHPKGNCADEECST